MNQVVNAGTGGGGVSSTLFPHAAGESLGGLSGAGASGASGAKSFDLSQLGDSFQNVLDEVNAQQANANQAVQGLLQGQNTNLSSVVNTMIKAELSLKMLLEVRNKVVEAHQELMRMQV